MDGVYIGAAGVRPGELLGARGSSAVTPPPHLISIDRPFGCACPPGRVVVARRSPSSDREREGWLAPGGHRARSDDRGAQTTSEVGDFGVRA